MKGTLHKTEQGWMVATAFITTPPSGTTFLSGKEFPLHPDDAKTYDWLYQSYTQEEYNRSPTEVEFEIVKEYIDSHTNQVQKYAKLIGPKTGSEVDLEKLQAKFDKLFSEETPESFHKWLESKRGPIRSYHSPKIDELLKEIEEEDIENLADQSWEDCDGCTKSDEVIYKNGYVHGYNAAKNQVPDVRKMVEDDVEKLALKPSLEYATIYKDANTFDFRKGYEAGYNKAKETLYTEEQVMEAMLQISEYYSDNLGKDLDGHKKALEIIKSLKQPIHASIDKDFEKDLFQLINDYVKKGLPKSDLVRKMEYVTQSCKMS